MLQGFGIPSGDFEFHFRREVETILPATNYTSGAGGDEDANNIENTVYASAGLKQAEYIEKFNELLGEEVTNNYNFPKHPDDQISAPMKEIIETAFGSLMEFIYPSVTISRASLVKAGNATIELRWSKIVERITADLVAKKASSNVDLYEKRQQLANAVNEIQDNQMRLLKRISDLYMRFPQYFSSAQLGKYREVVIDKEMCKVFEGIEVHEVRSIFNEPILNWHAPRPSELSRALELLRENVRTLSNHMNLLNQRVANVRVHERDAQNLNVMYAECSALYGHISIGVDAQLTEFVQNQRKILYLRKSIEDAAPILKKVFSMLSMRAFVQAVHAKNGGAAPEPEAVRTLFDDLQPEEGVCRAQPGAKRVKEVRYWLRGEEDESLAVKKPKVVDTSRFSEEEVDPSFRNAEIRNLQAPDYIPVKWPDPPCSLEKQMELKRQRDKEDGEEEANKKKKGDPPARARLVSLDETPITSPAHSTGSNDDDDPDLIIAGDPDDEEPDEDPKRPPSPNEDQGGGGDKELPEVAIVVVGGGLQPILEEDGDDQGEEQKTSVGEPVEDIDKPAEEEEVKTPPEQENPGEEEEEEGGTPQEEGEKEKEGGLAKPAPQPSPVVRTTVLKTVKVNGLDLPEVEFEPTAYPIELRKAWAVYEKLVLEREKSKPSTFISTLEDDLRDANNEVIGNDAQKAEKIVKSIQSINAIEVVKQIRKNSKVRDSLKKFIHFKFLSLTDEDVRRIILSIAPGTHEDYFKNNPVRARFDAIRREVDKIAQPIFAQMLAQSEEEKKQRAAPANEPKYKWEEKLPGETQEEVLQGSMQAEKEKGKKKGKEKKS